MILTRLTVWVLVQGLTLHIAPDTVVADKEVLVSAGVGLLCPLLLANINLEPAAANVSGVSPQHLGNQNIARVI